MFFGNGWIGKKAPEIVPLDKDRWLNSKPLKMKELLGKVVLVDIWDYTCVNCIRTLPYIREWDKKYGKLGLVTIGVHVPEFKFAKERKNVEDAAKKFGLTYPIVLDNDYEIWQSWYNNYWPRKFLIDAKGVVRYDHAGEGGYGETEAEIQKLLLEMDPKLKLPKIMEPVREEDKPGSVCYPVTPETYCGFQRGELGNKEGYKPNIIVDYKDVGDHEDSVVYLQGLWVAEPENLRHARNTKDYDDYLLMKYHAIEANLVIRSEKGKSFKLLIEQDGKPLNKEDRGEDIKEEKEKTYLFVDEPRMYKLINNKQFGTHVLKIYPNTDEFGAYAFTFTSCVM